MLSIRRVCSIRLHTFYSVYSFQKTRHYSNQEQWKKLKVLFMGRDEFSCLVLDELYKAQGTLAHSVVKMIVYGSLN